MHDGMSDEVTVTYATTWRTSYDNLNLSLPLCISLCLVFAVSPVAVLYSTYIRYYLQPFYSMYTSQDSCPTATTDVRVVCGPPSEGATGTAAS